jgi:hypothetical protein
LKKLPQRDPEAAYVRAAIAARRIGCRKCACGEERPEALIRDSDPMICIACQRKQRGQTAFDMHHPAGEANSPTKTPIWVNDHVAVFNVLQHDWPKTTLENPDRSPLLAAAGRNRGYIETNAYLIELLCQNTEVLEALDAHLKKRLGEKWWVGTELEQFVPNHVPRKRVTNPSNHRRKKKSGSQ